MMSTFPFILPTSGREAAQRSEGQPNTSASASGPVDPFADVIAQALSPAANKSVVPTGQTNVETGKNQPLVKSEVPIEVGKLYVAGSLARQIASGNNLSSDPAGSVFGRNDMGAQPSVRHSNPPTESKSSAKSPDASKADKNTQLQAGSPAGPVQPEIPIHQMVVEATSAISMVSKPLPESVSRVTPIVPQRTVDKSPPERRINPAQSKPVSNTPVISRDTLEVGTEAGQSSAVSKALAATVEATDSAAKNVAPSFDSIKSLLPEAKPNASTGQSLAESAPTQAPSDSNGISVAKQDISVKQADKTNNIAGQTEKVLPGNTVIVAQGNSRSPVPVHFEQTTAAVQAGSEEPSAPVDASVSVHASIPVSSNSDAIDHAQEMITVNAARLSDSGNNAMQVVIKPDAGTQLSLELRQHGSSVDVHAVLQQGDFSHLNQQWPDLQQRLAQRGIQLAPLTDNGAAAYNASGESFQQKQQQTTEPMSEASVDSLTVRQPVPTIIHAPLIVHESAQGGWETWA